MLNVFKVTTVTIIDRAHAIDNIQYYAFDEKISNDLYETMG